MERKLNPVESVEEQAVEHSPSASVMPDFTRPRYGYYHTIDSALASLSRAGVPPERITIKKVGPGWQQDRIVQQEPAPGTPLTGTVAVELTIEGEGLFYHLPTGMRELGPDPEREPGIQAFADLFDDPLEKAAHYVRQGGLYFDIRPEHPAGCAQWIRLFGIIPEDWPPESWYKLAILLPRLHFLAGREVGLRVALKLLLDLDVVALCWRQRRTPLTPQQFSRLGERASRLDVDLIVGDGLNDETTLDMTVGPISLSTYRKHQTSEGTRILQQICRLVLPYHLDYAVHWLVGDTTRAPRLGIDQENAILGVNTHLGRI